MGHGQLWCIDVFATHFFAYGLADRSRAGANRSLAAWWVAPGEVSDKKMGGKKSSQGQTAVQHF